MPVFEPNIATGKFSIHRHGIGGWWLDRLDVGLVRRPRAVLVDTVFIGCAICTITVKC